MPKLRYCFLSGAAGVQKLIAELAKAIILLNSIFANILICFLNIVLRILTVFDQHLTSTKQGFCLNDSEK